MSNAKKGFVLYFDSCPMLEALPPEQRGWLLSAVYSYADRIWREPSTELEEILDLYPMLTSQARAVFGFLASNLRRDTLRWLKQQETCEQRRQPPKKGAPKEPAPPTEKERAEMRAYFENLRHVLADMDRVSEST